jgi:hypothetical protein
MAKDGAEEDRPRVHFAGQVQEMPQLTAPPQTFLAQSSTLQRGQVGGCDDSDRSTFLLFLACLVERS